MRVRLGGWVSIALLLLATPTFGHHISGTVYCDQDGDGVIDVPGDNPVPGVTAVATSLDVSPGQQWADGTDGNGFYYIGLPARTDRYTVTLVGLPGGWTIAVPPGGVHTIQIITGTSQNKAENVNFLVQGCAPPPTTSTTTTTTTTAPTSTSSTSSTSTITTTTTTTTSTSTTLAPICDCSGTPFLVNRSMRLNNDASVSAGLGANSPTGRVRLGRRAAMPDGQRIVAHQVSLGVATTVYSVLADQLWLGTGAVVRSGTGTPSLPIIDPFCTLPPITCGTEEIQVAFSQSLGPLPPGTYGAVRVMNDATLTLAAGEFTFCSIRTGRNAKITTLGPATLNVAGNVIIGTGSRLWPATGMEPIRVNSTGTYLRISAAAVANAAIVAPAARITFGRDAFLLGCFCTDRAGSDKDIALACPTP